MQYLLEIEWTDPIASAVAQALSALPHEVEQTRNVPTGVSRGFVVLTAGDRDLLDGVVQAVTAAGADVRIIAGAER